jgi:hypothetical protein
MKILICLILSFCSFCAFANAAPMLSSFAPSSTTVTHVGGSVLNVGTNYTGRNAANSAVYAFRNVPVQKATFASILKKRAGSLLMNPWLAAAFIAADLIYDSNSGDIGQPDGSFISGYYWANSTSMHSGYNVASTAQGSYDKLIASGVYSSWTVETPLMQYADGKYQAVFRSGSSTQQQVFWRFQCTGSSPAASVASCAEVLTPVTPRNDADLYTDIAPSLSPSQWKDLWKNPETNKLL